MSSSSSRKCISVSFDEIRKATNGFDEKKILGKGGEGTVYSAHLHIGPEECLVAVKNLDPKSKEFEEELKIMQKIHHPNIVSLLGFCKESAHKILIYEYMGKGSLSKYVRGKNILPMSWNQTLKVCLGAARGLKYLHTSTKELPKGIIHRDVKPDNILIDENWVGKMSDFGLFKVSHADQTMSLITTDMKGTMGYFAPEYQRFGRITRKIDVYSFGVVLFEVLCLKKPWDRDESYYISDDDDQGKWAQQNIHSRIADDISHDCMIVFTDIITRSLKGNPNMRPSMDDVVLDLENAMKCQNLADEAKLSKKGTRYNEEDFPLKCPPGGEDKVVLYTSRGVIRKTNQACKSLREILVDHQVKFEERDSWQYRKFTEELQKLVGELKYPRLFVKGRDIPLDNFHENGHLIDGILGLYNKQVKVGAS